jgi:hypothetical protein
MICGDWEVNVKHVLSLTQQATGSALADQLQAMSHLAEGETAEESFPEQPMVLPGCIMPDHTESDALACAEDWMDWADTAWTDRSRLNDG